MSTRVDAGIPPLRKILAARRQAGQSIGFVPTMGYLHPGHQSLIKASRERDLYTVVSVFVNPTQFGPNEDFESYPRDAERDFQLATQAGADLVWYPATEDLYAPESQTMVQPGALAKRLCGLSRPHFFGGICTVVLKLFQIIRPDHAFFGEKDFQQLAIIKRMAADFYVPVEVVGCPTVREADGLAMSSRNARIKPEDRPLALTLFRTIQEARRAFRQGERDALRLRAALLKPWPDQLELDYLDFREPQFLEKVTVLAPDVRLFLGAWLRGVRLIDNAGCAGTPMRDVPVRNL